jgi:thioredoxin reductase
MSPLDLLEAGRAEVRRYGGHIVTGTATSVTRSGLEGESPEFAVTLAGGRVTRARRLLVTTGLVDELPDVAGLRERWGRDVVHCPYCHGWEIRDQPIGILASGPRAVHQALLFRQWSAGITLFLHTTPAPSRDETAQLAARGITVVPGVVASLESGDDRITGVRLDNGTVVPVRALAVGPRMVARSGVLATLGLKPAEHPLGAGEYIAGDMTGLTEVPGVWVAGNVADLMAAVPGSVASGSLAAAAINADLIAEETAQAVAAAG